MAKVEIAPGLEIDIRDNDGVVEMSSLPESLRPIWQKELDRMYGKGAAKAGEEARKQMESEIAKVREDAKKHGADPVLAEKAKNLEQELSKLKEDEAIRTQNWQEAQRLRDERHANELAEVRKGLTEREKEIERRTARISELVTSDIRLAAQRHGAREQSLAELDMLLRGKIGLDKDLQAYVKDEQDPEKPAVGTDGKTPVTIDGLVQQYLTDHPHHKAAPAGRGGGAGGGASLAGNKGNVTEFAQAVERAAQSPTVPNIADAISKIRAGAKAS